MARKNLLDTLKEVPVLSMEDLPKVISSYIKNKDLEKEYKDLASDENTQIKVAMEKLNITECVSAEGNMVAKVSEQRKESFREDELIEFLKTNNLADDIVKTKEYIDFDALEDALYKEKIPSELVVSMNAFKDVVVTKVLRVSKMKGGSE